jgi:hypothetical protein
MKCGMHNTPKCANGCLNKRGHPVEGTRGRQRDHCTPCGRYSNVSSRI